MATSSIVGGSQAPEEFSGKDLQALGPSDNSDSGSDAIGAYSDEALAGDSDSLGTGERASIDPDDDRCDADIRPDHIERAPGVGDGVDDESSDLDADLSDLDGLTDDSEDLDSENQGEGEDDKDAGASRRA